MRNTSAENLQRPPGVTHAASLNLLHRDAHSLRGEAVLRGRRLGRVIWAKSGQLLHWQPLDASGRPHGVELEYDDAGRVVWCAAWSRGAQHGPVIQFDERGEPLLVTEFVKGRGTDIWIDGDTVSEVREICDGALHGLLRWGDPRRPSEEGHYAHGRRHGVFRRWEEGRLARGFPRYYVDDQKVTQRVYEKACAADPSLPPYGPAEDLNRRSMPEVVRVALNRARDLRRQLRLVKVARGHGAAAPGAARSQKT